MSAPARTRARARAATPREHVHDTLVVGAGFAGLGAALRLHQAGVDDVVILERADDVGGTWRDSTYPGAACDIPSVLYSYSFAQNPTWSRVYSPSEEILRYIHHLVDEFDLRRLIRFGVEVTGLRFDEAEGRWEVSTRDASGTTYLARTVVLASGPLSNASLPRIPGIETYEGHKIHSARWDHDFDVAGKRVAVVGTGASAIQIIPELVKRAEHVTVFQRTPGWVIPRLDAGTPAPVRALFAHVPGTQTLTRQGVYLLHETMATGMVWSSPVTRVIEELAKAHLRHQVKDPWMRRQLTPDFRAGCKRMLVSNDYYPALQADNCKLITWPIARMSPAGIRTAAGIEHHLDAVVFATGYDVSTTGSPIPVTGLDGRDLGTEWSRGAFAYRSVNVAGYPNLFLTFGPNSGPGHNSALVYMEGQIRYLVDGITHILGRDLRYLDVKDDAQRAYNERMQRRLRRTTWNSGCSSWYLTPDGFNPSMYPGFATQYLRQLSHLRTEDYVAVPRTAGATARPRVVAAAGA